MKKTSENSIIVKELQGSQQTKLLSSQKGDPIKSESQTASKETIYSEQDFRTNIPLSRQAMKEVIKYEQEHPKISMGELKEIILTAHKKFYKG